MHLQRLSLNSTLFHLSQHHKHTLVMSEFMIIGRPRRVASRSHSNRILRIESEQLSALSQVRTAHSPLGAVDVRAHKVNVRARPGVQVGATLRAVECSQVTPISHICAQFARSTSHTQSSRAPPESRPDIRNSTQLISAHSVTQSIVRRLFIDL